MAEANATPADGVVDETKNQETSTPEGTGEPDKKEADPGAAQPGKEDDKPVTQRDLRRILKSKDHWKERALRLEGELKARSDAKPKEDREDAPQPPKQGESETYEDFLERKATWVAEQRAAKIVEERLKARDEQVSKAKAEEADRTLTQNWQKSVEKVRDKYDDYDEVTQDEGFNPTPAMARAMLESDQKAEIAYYLAKNPEEMERIAKMSPLRQAAEVLKLEDKVASKAPAKKPSKAPAPIDPVGGKSGSEGRLRDDLPMDEWLRIRNKQVYGS